MSEVAIKIDNVSKTFRLPHERNTSVKSAIVNFWRQNRSYETQEALKNVSFEINKGEFFGIVGRNGSGKSTLLKLLAGIYSTSGGSVSVNGKLTPFIELGVGFNPELTGRENVFLNGALLGFSRKEMQRMYGDIVEFAELERFMDQKLKNYSSGMQVRLAFSIAIRVRSDILLIDEVLAVGDEAFQKKCIATFRQIKNRGTTVVFVSHDMAIVEQFCDRAVLLNNGKLIFDGGSSEVARQYEDINRGPTKGAIEEDNRDVRVDSEGLGVVEIKTRLLNKEGKYSEVFNHDQDIVVESTISAKKPIDKALYSFTFENEETKTLCQFSTDDLGMPLFSLKKDEIKTITTTVANVLSEGNYFIDPDVSTIRREIIYGHVDNAGRFEVKGKKPFPWLIRPTYSMTVKNSKTKD